VAARFPVLEFRVSRWHKPLSLRRKATLTVTLLALVHHHDPSASTVAFGRGNVFHWLAQEVLVFVYTEDENRTRDLLIASQTSNHYAIVPNLICYLTVAFRSWPTGFCSVMSAIFNLPYNRCYAGPLKLPVSLLSR